MTRSSARTCPKCGGSRRKDRSYCKDCQNIYGKIYYGKNSKRLKQYKVNRFQRIEQERQAYLAKFRRDETPKPKRCLGRKSAGELCKRVVMATSSRRLCPSCRQKTYEDFVVPHRVIAS